MGYLSFKLPLFSSLSFGLARVGAEGHEGTSLFQNNLFIWMPRTEMSEQVVLLVEVKGAYKALEGSPDKWMVRKTEV